MNNNHKTGALANLAYQIYYLFIIAELPILFYNGKVSGFLNSLCTGVYIKLKKDS